MTNAPRGCVMREHKDLVLELAPPRRLFDGARFR